jgi:restriction endonuclease S subunit
MKNEANSVGQPNLFQNQIKKLPIYLPLMETQTKFATIIEKIEEQKALYEKELKLLEDNFNSLLQKSFS